VGGGEGWTDGEEADNVKKRIMAALARGRSGL
jgi:hypothetical protein